MNIQELETIRRLNLPIKMFVLSNHGYGAIQTMQTNLFHKHFVACNDKSNLSMPSIAKVAEASGLKSLVINNNKELEQKVQEVFSYEGPIICEVMTPIDLTAIPKQVSYKRADGQMESLPLEYMSPALDDGEMRDNMLI